MTATIAGQLNFDDLLAEARPDSSPREGDDMVGGEGEAPIERCDPGHGPNPALPDLDIEVVRSRRRRKTAEARLVGSTLTVRIPASCSTAEERRFVDHFVAKFERSRRASLVDLDRRADELATAYDLPRPASIRWVSNQLHQWGSCTPAERTIRLSDRMAGFPRWVVDYVIVHELAHLVEADHGPAFWALVERYPRTERARGYLMAKEEL